MRFEFDGPPDWVVDLGNPAATSNEAASTPALQALVAAAERRAAHPLDHQAIDALRSAVLAAVRAGIGDSQIAAAGRISVGAVRRLHRLTE